MAVGKQECLDALSGAGVSFTLVEHEEAPTVDVHTSELQKHGCAGAQVKNLVLKDKSQGGRLILVSCEKGCAIDLKALSARLDVPKSSPLRMANEDVMSKVLGVSKGSVTPLCLGFVDPADAGSKLVVLLDAKMKTAERVLVHPMDNTATVAIAPADLEAFIRRNDAGGEAVAAGQLFVAWVHFDSADKIATAAAAAKPAAKPAAVEDEKLDKRARMEKEKQSAAASRPDGPPENGVPSWAFSSVGWESSIFREPTAGVAS